MPRFGGENVLTPPHRQQMVLLHQAQHPLVVHRQPLVLQLPTHPPITVAAAMLHHDFLDLGAHLHLLLPGLVPLPVTIETGPAHLSQLAHSLDGKATLRLHYSHLFVNAVSPQPLLLRGRASILRKAPLKNSTSSTLLASAACKRCFSCSRC